MHLALQILMWLTIYIVLGIVTGVIGIRVSIWIDDSLREEYDWEDPPVVGGFAAWVALWPLGLVVGLIVLICYGFYHLFRQCMRKALPSG